MNEKFQRKRKKYLSANLKLNNKNSLDIKTKNFKIPQLTLQPLIENAVKHGICKNRKGGTVKIYTREFEDYNEMVRKINNENKEIWR